MVTTFWYAAQFREGHCGPVVQFILRYMTIEEARAARDGLDCSAHDAVVWPPDPRLSPAAQARLERDGVWKAIEREVARRRPLSGGPEMVERDGRAVR